MKKQIFGFVAILLLSATISFTSKAHSVNTNVSAYSFVNDTTPHKMYSGKNHSDSSWKKNKSKMKNKSMHDSTNNNGNANGSGNATDSTK